MVDLSVIIVNYNVRSFLENALASIYRALEGIEGEVFVVDNASDDGSVDMVRRVYPRVQVLRNEENVGFAKANNMALRQARGRFCLLINPDTVVQEDTFRVMMQFFRDHPDAGLAGCRVLNPDGTFQLACRRSFPTPWVALTKTSGLSTVFPRSRLFGRYNLTFRQTDETYPVDAVSGSFMMFRREVYEKVGGLDETFFMYGEDLDYCYRVAQTGFKVYYVHSTSIVHFKGESTRRSNVDEIRLFYLAMEQFVDKHFSRSRVVKVVLRAGILVRAAAASFARAARPIMFAAMDFLLVALAFVLAEFFYFGEILHFPRYAYPIVWTVPGLIVISVGFFARLYTSERYSIGRAVTVILAGYIMISALVFFAKNFAFSRAVVLISGVLVLLFLPGWRFLARRAARGAARGRSRRSIFGSRTLIVGTGPAGQEVLRRLRTRIDDGYDVQGFIDTDSARIGEHVSVIEIVGSLENVGKVIDERRITDVIFSTDELPYGQILSVIGRSSGRAVNFRLVPNSLEAIIGKTRIDDLDTLPMVEIDYGIRKLSHRCVKRTFDLAVALPLLLTVYPLAAVVRALRGSPGMLAPVLRIPSVVRGTLSLVGLPLHDMEYPLPARNQGAGGIRGLDLGPRGLTGLVQLNARPDSTPEELERYVLYYAKNQSLLLDLEILLKSVLTHSRKS